MSASTTKYCIVTCEHYTPSYCKALRNLWQAGPSPEPPEPRELAPEPPPEPPPEQACCVTCSGTCSGACSGTFPGTCSRTQLLQNLLRSGTTFGTCSGTSSGTSSKTCSATCSGTCSGTLTGTSSGTCSRTCSGTVSALEPAPPSSVELREPRHSSFCNPVGANLVPERLRAGGSRVSDFLVLLRKKKEPAPAEPASELSDLLRSLYYG